MDSAGRVDSMLNGTVITQPSIGSTGRPLIVRLSLPGSKSAGTALSVCSPQTFGAVGGDMCSFAIPGDMPVNVRGDAGGALQFHRPVPDDPLDLLGQPSLSLRVAADCPQGFVAVLLIDEAPDGAQTLLLRGFCNLTHRNRDTTPTPVTPGEEMDVTLPLHGIGCRVLAGHRIVVQVASAYWPVLWPAPAPVTLPILPGSSSLHLPIRNMPMKETTPRALPVPPKRDGKRPLTTSDARA